jgi:ubiquinone biosynthesis protein Coq4
VLVGEARARYFAENGFGDGGYDDRFVVLRVAGVPALVFPNTKQRVRSVRIHDVHHVLTGYATSWRGEGEIGAWELASGCRDHWAAWFLNFWAAAIGLCIAPRAIWRAFRRGRVTRNLYAREWDDAILARSVEALRHDLGLDANR